MPVAHATETLTQVADRLAAFQAVDAPVLSLYLDTRADEHGRDHWEPFVRKELAASADAERIRAWLARELRRASNGVAVFACSAAGLFEALQLEAPFPENSFHSAPEPHVYPLLRLLDRHPRFAVLLTDTNHARLYVFGLGQPAQEQAIESEKLTRTQQGGWSQQSYQRHVDDHYRQHAKKAVEALERTVRGEDVRYVLLAGDEVIVPLLREQLSPGLASKVVDVLALDIRTPEHEVHAAGAEALGKSLARTAAEKVRQLLDQATSRGLAVTGLAETRKALELGQVRELLITTDPAQLVGESDPARRGETADRLVKLARRTSAEVTFIEDPGLAGAEGVGAILRYRLEGEQSPAA